MAATLSVSCAGNVASLNYLCMTYLTNSDIPTNSKCLVDIPLGCSVGFSNSVWPNRTHILVFPVSVYRLTIHATNCSNQRCLSYLLFFSLPLDQEVLSVLSPNHILNPSVSLQLHCNPLRRSYFVLLPG